LRPDDVVNDDGSRLRANLRHKAFRGAQIPHTLELASGARAVSMVPSHQDHAFGEAMGIRLQMDHLIAFRHAGLASQDATVLSPPPSSTQKRK
jgi:iron(III) transport system ATP-binding protein